MQKPQEQKDQPAMKIVVLGDRNRLRGGERSDVLHAMSYRTGDEKLVWYKIGDSEYLLKDAAMFKLVDDSWEKALGGDPPDFSYIEALLKRFADGGRATKIK